RTQSQASIRQSQSTAPVSEQLFAYSLCEHFVEPSLVGRWTARRAQFRANVIDGLRLPEPLEIIERTERAAAHLVDIHVSAQVIDLVLQDARVPSRSFDHFRAAVLIEAFHANAARSRHNRGKARQAQAAFEKLGLLLGRFDDPGIDDHLKRHGAPLTLGKLLRGNFLEPVLAILKHCDLQRTAYLAA